MKRLTAILLTLGIILAIVADSTDFFFHRPYYEYWDLGASSLCVDRAKHFAQLYGSYSRFGWHHPGPIFFYVWAFGEWLFYDLLHLTPAPYNAQTLANLFVTTSFFVATLTVFSRWVSAPARWWFVTGALVLGAMHFGAVPRMPSYDMLLGSSVFTSAWTAHTWVFPFLCLLTAGASVAAGRGEDLPLLALADGFLIHAHIAAPLFVGPISLFAYGGLLILSDARERALATAAGGSAGETARWRPRWRTLGAAWRVYPRVHLVTLAILAFFALPMVIDLFLGDASNLHAVLMHLRTYHGKHKTFKRAVFYFLQFGAYRSYRPHFHYFDHFDTHGTYAYFMYHKKIYAAWLVGVLLLIWTSGVRPALVALGRWRDDEAGLGMYSGMPAAVPGRTRFLALGGILLACSIVLTLYWAVIQDGDMMYYSAWINFAIYYFGLLIVWAEFSSVLALGVRRWRGGALMARPAWGWIERWVPAGVVVLACVLEAHRFRVADSTPEMTRAMHEANLHVIRDAKARNPDGIKMLDLPVFVWPTATGLALEMERQGMPFMVVSYYTIPFPADVVWHPTPEAAQAKMEVWHFDIGRQFKLWHSGMPRWFDPFATLLDHQVAASRQVTPTADGTLSYPLLLDVNLRIVIPDVDPNAPGGASVDLRRNSGRPPAPPYGYAKHPEHGIEVNEVGTCPGFAVGGFGQPESWGSWSDGPGAMLRLRGKPVGPSENVEVAFDVHPFLDPDAHLTSQRMGLALNGTPLGATVRLEDDTKVTYTVPGDLWNRTFGRTVGAALEFGFPDAVSPAILNHDSNADTRQMGVGFRAISFRTVPATNQPPALGLSGPGSQAEIDFKSGGNAATFAADGWYAPETWGTWTSGHRSQIHFRSPLIGGTREVEIAMDIHAVMDNGSMIKGQRLRVSLGDETFDREHIIETGGSLVLTVPAATWNAAVANNAEAVLQLELPDAISPARIDPTGLEQDDRQLGLGIAHIRFRNVPAPVVTAR